MSHSKHRHQSHYQLLAVESQSIADHGKGVAVDYAIHPSPFGPLFVALANGDIHRLAFSANEYAELAVIQHYWPDATFHHTLTSTGQALRKAIACENAVKEMVSLRVKGTEFQHRVWQALLTIPCGELRSYQQVAEQIGQGRACRAVGSAIGANPVAWLIPCHRVIRANGEYGQYHWGADIKRAMIETETIKASADKSQPSSFAANF